MVVLIDTDILIDFLIDREPFTENAKNIIQKSQESIITAYMAAHSITNIFHILRKMYSVSERKQRLMDLCKIIPVVEIGHDLIVKSLGNNNFDDIEDCLQNECARAVSADFIITRDIEGYVHSEIQAILPDEFLLKIKTGNP